MRFEHQFVEFIPDTLMENILYVSVRFGTVAHLCACGCREEVITPLGPAEWSIVYDGKSVSLKPSIGNWGFPCRSHYWIFQNKIRWARKFDVIEVEEIRERNKIRRGKYFDQESATQKVDPNETNSLLARMYRKGIRLLSRLGRE